MSKASEFRKRVQTCTASGSRTAASAQRLLTPTSPTQGSDIDIAIGRLLEAKQTLKQAERMLGDSDPKKRAEAIQIERTLLPDYHTLRTKLEVGQSLFDYPGLLAVSSHVHFSKDTYLVFFGVVISKDEPEQPFVVKLDQRGIIRAVYVQYVFYD